MKRALAVLVLLAGATSVGADDTQVTRTALRNGMRVLVRENPAAGVVAISLLVRAGARFETSESAGITNLLHRVMVRGTTRRSDVEVATAAEDIGGSVDGSGDVEYAEIRGTALARHWDTLLALVAEVALHPALPAHAIETERRLVLSDIQTRADAPLSFALDTLTRDLYAGHPYAFPAAGLRGTVERFSRDTLLAHYRAIYRPNRLVLAVSGQVAPARVTALAEKLFAEMASAGPPLIEPAPPVLPSGGRRVVERPAQQAQVLVGFPGAAVTDPDYAAVKLLGAVLGGGTGGRLFTELRGRQGLAYSLGVINPSRAGPALLLGYLGTAPASAEAAEAAMLREIERVRAEPPSDAELARARAYLLGTQAMDRRTNVRQAWYLAFFELIGAGHDFPDRYAERLSRVSPADVQAVARRYLERPTIVVLRPH